MSLDCMRVYGTWIDGRILQAAYDAVPSTFHIDHLTVALKQQGVGDHAYRTASMLIQRLRTASLITKHGTKGQSIRWSKNVTEGSRK